MKTFDEFLNEDRLELAAILLEQRDFPLYGLAEWYVAEGSCLSEEELAQVMAGFWDEANTFWGDTWRGAAKGAGIGAASGGAAGGMFGGLPGAGIGAGIGGAIGGVGGGLYGMGKNLWRKLRGNRNPEPTPAEDKPDYAALLKKLQTDHPELGLDADSLIARLGKPSPEPEEDNVPPTVPHEPRQPIPHNPLDYDSIHPAYKRRGVHPFGDHTIN